MKKLIKNFSQNYDSNKPPEKNIEINEIYLNSNEKIRKILKFNKEFPKYKVDLTPLSEKLHFSEAVKRFKSNNEFLFKATAEEKDLTKKIQCLTIGSLIPR